MLKRNILLNIIRFESVRINFGKVVCPLIVFELTSYVFNRVTFHLE